MNNIPAGTTKVRATIKLIDGMRFDRTVYLQREADGESDQAEGYYLRSSRNITTGVRTQIPVLVARLPTGGYAASTYAWGRGPTVGGTR